MKAYIGVDLGGTNVRVAKVDDENAFIRNKIIKNMIK